jgi:glycosyl transferase family 87
MKRAAAAVAGFALAAAATIALGLGVKPAVLYLVVPIAFLVWHARRDALAANGRLAALAAADGGALGMAAVFAARALDVARRNILAPEEWDFQAFWLWGRAAARGLNPYLPESIHQVDAGLQHTASFTATVVDVGFPYPPITMLLLRPFGGFDLPVACALWYLVQGAALAAAVWMIWRHILGSRRWPDLVLAGGLLACLRPMQTTVHLAQTNFLILLALALYWRDRARARGGVWLALGLAVKPWVAVMMLHPLVRRRLGVIAAGLAATAALFLAAAAAFGAAMESAYIHMAMVGSMPVKYFSAEVNQSLLATILRLFMAPGTGTPDPRTLLGPQILFLVIAAALTLVTALLVHRLGAGHDDLGLLLVLVLALIVYPGTLYHYGVMLIVPLVFTWTRRDTLGVPAAAAGTLVTACFVLVGASHARFVFAGITLVWCALAAIAWRTTRSLSGSRVTVAAPAA